MPKKTKGTHLNGVNLSQIHPREPAAQARVSGKSLEIKSLALAWRCGLAAFSPYVNAIRDASNYL